MSNVEGQVCPKCKSEAITLLRPSQLLQCDSCHNTFTKLESSLVNEYPHLCTIVTFLVQRAKSPLSNPQEKKDAELALKDVRVLLEKTKQAKVA